LSGGSPAGGTYSGTGVSGGNFDPATAGSGTHTITYSYTDINGCTNSANNTITVNALPTVNVGPFTDVCISAPLFALSGGNPAGGYYSGTGVSSNNFDPAVAGIGIHFINYTYTDGNGCTNTNNAPLTVYALPNVTLGAFTDVCISAAPFALSGGSPAGGTYSGTGVSGGNFDPSIAGIGTHTITYTYTDGNSCTNSANNTITVYNLPSVNLSAFADVCINAPTFALSGGTPAGGNYSGTGVSGNNFSPSVAGIGTHTITYTYTDGNGCSNSTNGSITVNGLPTVTLSAQSAVCISAPSFPLSGGSPSGGTYSGNGVSGGNFSPAGAGAGTHTITYTYTDGNGCTNTANNTLTVYALPTVSVASFANVCISASSFPLSGGSPVGGTYSGTGVSGGNFDPAVAGVGTFTVTYSYTDGNGCSATASEDITVVADPVVTASTADDQLCAGDVSVITAVGASSYAWTPGGQTTSSINVNPNSTTTYTVLGTTAGCTASETITINVTLRPVLTTTYNIESCIGAKDADLDLNVTEGTPPYVYAWSGGEDTEDLMNLGTGNYSVTVSDSLGCNNSTTVTLGAPTELCYVPHIYIPNIFSPNNDGNNDLFFVRGMGITTFNLMIFDRWGKKVFESTDATQGWDGTCDGKLLEEGVFVYFVTATLEDGAEIKETGNISLVK
jgi:gliding motility-associated-like protein